MQHLARLTASSTSQILLHFSCPSLLQGNMSVSVYD